MHSMIPGYAWSMMLARARARSWGRSRVGTTTETAGHRSAPSSRPRESPSPLTIGPVSSAADVAVPQQPWEGQCGDGDAPAGAELSSPGLVGLKGNSPDGEPEGMRVDHVVRPQADRPVFQEGEPSATWVQAGMLEHSAKIRLGVRGQVLVPEEQVRVAQPGQSPGHEVVGVISNGAGQRSVPSHLPVLAWCIQPREALLP